MRTEGRGGPAGPREGTAGEVGRLMLRLGFTAFGGPAAHIAMLRGEVVQRRAWLGEQHYLDLLGITNLIPGPNSTEMVLHVGYERAGWKGLVSAGAGFILPAAALTLGFAVVYDRYATTAGGEWLLYGVKPVIIAVVAQALVGLMRTAIKGPWHLGLGIAVVALYLLGGNEIALLFGSAAVALAGRWIADRRSEAGTGGLGALGLGPWGFPGLLGLWRTAALPAIVGVAADASVGYSTARLFLTFLKIGSVLYGSGYVLLAFLRNDLVERYGWLTEQQLLDAVAVGQFTPGPVFTTATFVGYLVGGYPGAVLATVGIFLPAFVFVAVTNPLLPRLRRLPWVAAALDGVNLAAVGLMAAVAWTLGRSAVVDLPTALLSLAALGLLLRSRLNSAWLVGGGGLAGVAIQAAGLA